MTEPLIPASAIEAAARAMFPRYDGGNDDWRASYRANVAEGLRAAFDELGMETEYRSARTEIWGHGERRLERLRPAAQRLVSRWMPVEES